MGRLSSLSVSSVAVLLSVSIAACASQASTAPAVAKNRDFMCATLRAPAAETTSSSAPTETTSAPVEPPAAVPGEPLGSPLTNSPTTSSGDVADADSVVVGLRPKFRDCYTSARGKGPEIEGMVSCGVRITKEGKVASISVTRRDRLPNTLVECIVRELKTATFAPRADEAVIQVPVRFALPEAG
jgi:hypothetical protein